MLLRRRVVVFAVYALAIAATVFSATGIDPAPVEAAGSACVPTDGVPCVFTATGSAQTWTVPAGITEIVIDARGGAGAASALVAGTQGTGGAGARVQTTLTVTPGDVLQLMVGGAGSGRTGGFNGGAAGGTSIQPVAIGGGGGGASDVRTGSCAATLTCGLATRTIVAGGGGGGASLGGNGGPGGLAGGDGLASDSGGTPGLGATAGAGGAGGSRANSGSSAGGSGSLGLGGDGGFAACGCGGAGGGGGGVYGGGGGGYQGGGGGGSSLGPSGSTITGGANTGAGTISIGVPPVPDPPIGVADEYQVDEDVLLTVPAPGVLENDSDPDLDAITAKLVVGPSHASSFILNADGSFTYQATTDYNGPDSFTYKAVDPGSLESATTTVSITVLPVADLGLSVADTQVTEGDSGTTDLTFTLSSAVAPPAACTVSVSTAIDGDASSSDLTPISGLQVTIPTSGPIAVPVTVAVTGDVIDESDETFSLVITDGAANGCGAAALVDATAVGTIADDDGASISISNASVVEGTGSGATGLVFMALLSTPSAVTVTVDAATANGTASVDDFTMTTETLTFAPGDTTAMFIVPVVRDAIAEDDETMTANLTNNKGADLLDDSGLGRIFDDDEWVVTGDTTVTVTEADPPATASAQVIFTVDVPAPAGGVEFDWETVDGTAVAPDDYTASNGTAAITEGSTSVTIDIPIVSDGIDEPDESFTIVITDVRLRGAEVRGIEEARNTRLAPSGSGTSAVVTILDDDPAEVPTTSTTTPTTDPPTSTTTTTPASGPTTTTTAPQAPTTASTTTPLALPSTGSNDRGLFPVALVLLVSGLLLLVASRRRTA